MPQPLTAPDVARCGPLRAAGPAAVTWHKALNDRLRCSRATEIRAMQPGAIGYRGAGGGKRKRRRVDYRRKKGQTEALPKKETDGEGRRGEAREKGGGKKGKKGPRGMDQGCE